MTAPFSAQRRTPADIGQHPDIQRAVDLDTSFTTVATKAASAVDVGTGGVEQQMSPDDRGLGECTQITMNNGKGTLQQTCGIRRIPLIRRLGANIYDRQKEDMSWAILRPVTWTNYKHPWSICERHGVKQK
ncbi:hypothetical protein R3P38DRAFT_3380219 [Favolaschia claudopus]|uniref:Uncharacterized protein n=1 Tax=Favolaschia claudopus TaxID=2862362 RepID=A0AAV9Z3A5_9AGAR